MGCAWHSSCPSQLSGSTPPGVQERRLSARKPKYTGRENQFPGFNAPQEPSPGCGHQAFASTTPPRYGAEEEDSVDYSAVLQSLKNLPADLIASAPARRAHSQSGSGGSDGYRSDGVVDFELEVQQFEARSFNNKYCRADIPPIPSASHMLSAQRQEDPSGAFDMTTAHMRPSRHNAASTGNSSSQPGSLQGEANHSLRSHVDLAMMRSCGPGQGGRAGELPARCCPA